MNASTADLLLAHEHLIRSLARDLLADEHTVDDVVQQTWLVLCRAEAMRTQDLDYSPNTLLTALVR